MENTKLRGFVPYSVTLDEMMKEREERAACSRSMLARGTVVCMTMNLIGEYKVVPFSRSVFKTFVLLMKRLLNTEDVFCQYKNTGDTAFFVTELSPQEAKSLCERAEDSAPVGRLFDIDVFDENGDKLSRREKRKCLICDKTAAECSRSRAHGVDAVRTQSVRLLSDFFVDFIIKCAEDALEEEVGATPKPGLVDRRNSGANPDMTYEMFIDSARAVAPYLGRMAYIAGAYPEPESEMAHALQKLGLEAEKAMYKATGGVNTHKGAIYSLGLLCAGAGFVLSYGGKFTDVVTAASQIALELAKETTDTDTHGMRVCREYGVGGARGEAVGGFKTVLYAFEQIKHYADDLMLDTNTAFPLALCDVMGVMSDTNVLYRAGREGLDYLRKEAREISEMRPNQRIDELLLLDKELIKRNISPGGCADALACAILLLKLENLFSE